MIRNHFRVMTVDLHSGQGNIVKVEGRNVVAGGSGLAALLFGRYGHSDRPWDDPDQPLIFAIGPLTGYFPLMSKTVCAFKSPYHDQYAESHAGGRSALALRFADLDALVIIGRAKRPVCLSIGSRHLELKDVGFLWGRGVFFTGRTLRRMYPGSGHRSIFRIGPAGENQCAFACINLESYRHFGRLGSGAVMGAKNLKGIVIQGDAAFEVPEGKEYIRLFNAVNQKVTATTMMRKYHNLGTAANLAVLNELKSLPWRNLQQSSDTAIDGITGERFADDTLLRNMACSGCPVGCIHLGFVRQKFMEDNRYSYRQVSYDYEPIFATGSMLGITDAFAVLSVMDQVERMGLDVMSGGVALAWATEAFEKGLVSEKETIVPLKFGDAKAYETAIVHLAMGDNEFYRTLAQGTKKAAARYGGDDFACVLGQEMAGYATGEAFFISQALGFRHSHLDSGGYSYDQKQKEKDVEKTVEFLIQDEMARVFLTCMVSCLFAREVYTEPVLGDCLNAVGYRDLAENMDSVGRRVQKMRWQIRLKTGFDPENVTIPDRFKQVVTLKGPMDVGYMDRLKMTYAHRIQEMAKQEEIVSVPPE